jgi:uncharacterized repeat protein (TIGR03803 family)
VFLITSCWFRIFPKDVNQIEYIARSKIWKFNLEEDRMSKLNCAKRICFAFLLCAITANLLPAQTFNTLVNFDGTNGSGPYWGHLIQGTDGNFYGTTAWSGGNGNFGTVFNITPGGLLTTLYIFNFTEGANPFAGLVQGNDGNFYGTTQGGGSVGNGTVFNITSGGLLTTLFSFCAAGGYPDNCSDGDNPQSGLIQVADGSFYGTTVNGSTNHGVGDHCDYGCGTIFKITPEGTETTLYDFCSLADCRDGALPHGAALVQAIDANLYGTTESGGAHGRGTVFKISATGALTTLYSFCSQSDCADGATPSSGLVQATDGSFYGTTYHGGVHNRGTVFKISATGALTTLYSFCSQSDCADGAHPYSGLVQATDGNFYGTTYDGGAHSRGTVFQISATSATDTLKTLYSFCSQRHCADGAYPYAGLVQATDGSFYGTTYHGGANGDGIVFSLSVGLGPFVETLSTSGNVGTEVRILGTNLTGAESVTFNGTPAFFKVKSSSEIVAVVPPGATTGMVQVVAHGGTLSSNVPFGVQRNQPTDLP